LFLACVTGKHDWKCQTKTNLIIEIFSTIMDGALALLFLDKIWDVLINMNVLEFCSKICATTDNITEEASGGG